MIDRIQVSEVVQSEYNSKWAPRFKVYKTFKGEEYVAGEITSGFVFATPQEAFAAGDRAVYHLKETGMFPNMCEAF